MIKKITCEGFRGFSTRQTLDLAIPTGKRGSGLTTLIGPNGGGKSTLVECFVKFSARDVSFTEGKRNKKAGDKVYLSLLDDSEKLFELKTVSTGGSETTCNNPGQRPKIYYLPARRVFNPYLMKDLMSTICQFIED